MLGESEGSQVIRGGRKLMMKALIYHYNLRRIVLILTPIILKAYKPKTTLVLVSCQLSWLKCVLFGLWWNPAVSSPHCLAGGQYTQVQGTGANKLKYQVEKVNLPFCNKYTCHKYKYKHTTTHPCLYNNEGSPVCANFNIWNIVKD